MPKVPLNLGIKFLDFDSIERCLVLDLDSRYDLIQGSKVWLCLNAMSHGLIGDLRPEALHAMFLAKLWRVMNPSLLGNKITIGASLDRRCQCAGHWNV